MINLAQFKERITAGFESKYKYYLIFISIFFILNIKKMIFKFFYLMILFYIDIKTAVKQKITSKASEFYEKIANKANEQRNMNRNQYRCVFIITIYS